VTWWARVQEIVGSYDIDAMTLTIITDDGAADAFSGVLGFIIIVSLRRRSDLGSRFTGERPSGITDRITLQESARGRDFTIQIDQ